MVHPEESDIPGDWVEQEFGRSTLGDVRLDARLAGLARQLAQHPAGSLPQVLGDRSKLKAAYRFFDHSDITAQGILASHVECTYARIQQSQRVLIVQDTTYFDYSAHPKTAGMGPLQAQGGHGMLMHGVLAIAEDHVPLGVLSARMWSRTLKPTRTRSHNGNYPLEDKESAKWLDGVGAAETAHLLCPDTDIVMVADREADIHEVFARCADADIGFVVRVFRNRRTNGPTPMDLDTRLQAEPVWATQSIAVPQKGKQHARLAQVQIKALEMELMPPMPRKAALALPSLAPLWAVEVSEIAPPNGIKPLRWLLLTNVPVVGAADAQERVEWYRARWGIEIWHRVLKSGCRVEQRQLQSRERLERMIALYAVIAWRVMYATLLARSAPEMACTALLEQAEWKALYCRIHSTPVPCATAPPLRQAVRWIAKLGGFIGRKSDGEPGAMTIWRGFQVLYAITDMYRIFNPDPDIAKVDDG